MIIPSWRPLFMKKLIIEDFYLLDYLILLKISSSEDLPT